VQLKVNFIVKQRVVCAIYYLNGMFQVDQGIMHKIPSNQILVVLWGRGIFLHKQIGFSPSFPIAPNMLNSNFVQGHGKFLFKKSYKCNFLQFLWGSQLCYGYIQQILEWVGGGQPFISPKKSLFYQHIIGFWCFLSIFLPHGSP
jgi:hypothetical protein